MKLHNVLWFTLLLSTSVFSQKPIFRNYSVNEGLAGSNVYECYQDSEGYLWFSTETGVSRYDGLKFETYTIEDSLTDAEVFGVREDKKGRIWFLTSNGSICYFFQDKIYNEINTPLLKELRFTCIITDIHEDEYGNVWFSSENQGVKCITPQEHIKSYRSKTGNFSHIRFFVEKDHQLLAYKDKTKLIFQDTVFLKWETTPCKTHVNRRYNTNESFYYTCGKDIYTIEDENKTKLHLPNSIVEKAILSFLKDDHDEYWIGTRGSGLVHIPADTNQKVNVFLPGATVSHIYQDNEKNLWISTLEEGVYFLSVNNFLSYTESDGLNHNFVSTIAVVDDLIVTGSPIGNINVYNTSTNVLSSVDLGFDEGEFNKISGIVTDQQKRLWIATDKGLVIKSLQDGTLINKHIGSGKCIVKSGDDIYIGSSSGVYMAKGGRVDKLKLLWGHRTLAIYKSPLHDELWLGTLEGLYKYSIKYNRPQLTSETLLNRRITDIQSLDGENIFVGTYGYGLILVKKNGTLFSIGKEDAKGQYQGILSNFIRSFEIAEDSTLWISTDRGLSKIKFNEEYKFNSIIKNYTDADGLISEDVHKTVIKGDTIFVATAKGLTYFDYKHPKSNYLPPLIHLKNIKVNNKQFPISNGLELEYHENDLVFEFTAINFESVGDIRFEYQLEGIDKNWVSTNNTTVSYPSLQHGKYVFKIRAYSKSNLMSEETKRIIIIIHPHFTATTWFKIIVIFIISMVLFLIVLWRMNFIRKSNDVRAKISELEIKTLRTQMNPHFIFNTMSSIQQFVNSSDKKAANRYLSKFATLMRGILHNSDKSYVSIKDEFDLLKIYLELEALRMNNKFDYEITVERTINQTFTKIPPMLIQPFIENAILHGLGTLDGRKGLLKVDLQEAGDYLTCVIEDNGIGREKALEIKKRRIVKHESTAMRNIKERIELLRHNRDDNLNVEVIDLFDDNKQPTGTKIILTLPYN